MIDSSTEEIDQDVPGPTVDDGADVEPEPVAVAEGEEEVALVDTEEDRSAF